MPQTITDRAIVLYREQWRESDKRVIFYTEHHGKRSAVAIGAAKIRSKLAGHLEPLRSTRVMIASGKQTDKIAQALTIESFVPDPFDAQRIVYLGAVTRFISRAVESNAPDEELFGLLYSALVDISGASFSEPGAVDGIFGAHLFALATHVGYAPEFMQCVVCSRGEELIKFSPSQGGVVCRTCVVPGVSMVYEPAPEKAHTFVFEHLRWRGLI